MNPQTTAVADPEIVYGRTRAMRAYRPPRIELVITAIARPSITGRTRVPTSHRNVLSRDRLNAVSRNSAA